MLSLQPAFASEPSIATAAASTATTPTWSGCYLGANAGYGRAEADATDTPYREGPYAGMGVFWNDGFYDRISTDDGGLAGGVEAGCDRQFDLGGTALVLGGVLDFSLMNLGATGNSAISSNTRATFDMDWAASARLRAGVAASDVLFYVTGGYALANVDVRAFSTPTPPTSGEMDVSGGGTEGGWVAGGGVEWRFQPNWSVGLEYLHYDFGTLTATGAATFPPDAFPRFENDVTFDTVRIGLKWRM
ncbi:opacity protein-like surface antigen [Mycoplana sp. BE70]|uniref:outer membrane protein n=1 Tax=Mycoplana sp. BE70 TaxID=2817775 RepID=UPI002859AC36|nr:outer membrane beta-barrel protein [Mycoplana sp. BE70]MDR6759217.1 opacity protein-like surface antigen [Mycoplana sp. BE70]